MIRVEDRLITEKPAIRTGLLQSSNYGQRRTEVVMTKKCNKCGEEKPLTEFTSKKNSPDGLKYHCRLCATEKTRRFRGIKPPEYGVWVDMRQRCGNPKSINWHLYGERGISVCKRWDSFDSFYSDMGSRPSGRHQIDRIDNDGNYEPGNCRWVTPAGNSRNTRRCKLSIDIAREMRRIATITTLNNKEIGAIFGVKNNVVWHIIHNRIWKEDEPANN